MGCFDEAQQVFPPGDIGIGITDAADPVREVTACRTAEDAEGLDLLAARGADLQWRAGARCAPPSQQRHARQEFTPRHGLLLDACNSTHAGIS